MSRKKTSEEFNKELIKTLQKIVHPSELSKIYDRVLQNQQTERELMKQQAVLTIIQDYIHELDGHFNE